MNEHPEPWPDFLKIGNAYFFIGGMILIMTANITVFVFQTFLSLVGMISWPVGMLLLYLNYRKVKRHEN